MGVGGVPESLVGNLSGRTAGHATRESRKDELQLSEP